MDLVLYEPIRPFELPGAALDAAVTDRRVRGQVAAWLQKAVLVVLPHPTDGDRRVAWLTTYCCAPQAR